MYCIDGTKRGDITKTGLVWHFDKIRRSISTPAIKDGIVYQPDFSGFLYALDAKTGQMYWQHDVFAAVWGSPLLVDGKLYLGDEDGDVVICRKVKRRRCSARSTWAARFIRVPCRPTERSTSPAAINFSHYRRAAAAKASHNKHCRQFEATSGERSFATKSGTKDTQRIDEFRFPTSYSRDLRCWGDSAPRRAGARVELQTHVARCGSWFGGVRARR